MDQSWPSCYSIPLSLYLDFLWIHFQGTSAVSAYLQLNIRVNWFHFHFLKIVLELLPLENWHKTTFGSHFHFLRVVLGLLVPLHWLTPNYFCRSLSLSVDRWMFNWKSVPVAVLKWAVIGAVKWAACGWKHPKSRLFECKLHNSLWISTWGRLFECKLQTIQRHNSLLISTFIPHYF